MLRIKVCGIDEVVAAAFAFRAQRVVSMLDVDIDERHPEKFAKVESLGEMIPTNHHRVWRFEDRDNDQHPDGPKLDTTRDILEWASSGEPDERIIVHCHGGIGRSPAVSIGLMLMDGFEIEDATRILFASRIDQLNRTKTAMWPNRAILRHIQTLLGLADVEKTVERIKWEDVVSPDESTRLLALPRTPRKLLPKKPVIVPSVTEDMWKEASERSSTRRTK